MAKGSYSRFAKISDAFLSRQEKNARSQTHGHEPPKIRPSTFRTAKTKSRTQAFSHSLSHSLNTIRQDWTICQIKTCGANFFVNKKLCFSESIEFRSRWVSLMTDQSRAWSRMAPTSSFRLPVSLALITSSCLFSHSPLWRSDRLKLSLCLIRNLCGPIRHWDLNLMQYEHDAH
jgi:hypothetical protein